MTYLDIAFGDPNDAEAELAEIETDPRRQEAALPALRPDPEAQPPDPIPEAPKKPWGGLPSTAYGMAWKGRYTTVMGQYRHIIEAKPSGAFWQAWRHDKRAMKAAGYGVRPYGQNWIATNYKGEAREI